MEWAAKIKLDDVIEKSNKMKTEQKEKLIDKLCWIAVLSAGAYFIVRIIVGIIVRFLK